MTEVPPLLCPFLLISFGFITCRTDCFSGSNTVFSWTPSQHFNTYSSITQFPDSIAYFSTPMSEFEACFATECVNAITAVGSMCNVKWTVDVVSLCAIVLVIRGTVTGCAVLIGSLVMLACAVSSRLCN